MKIISQDSERFKKTIRLKDINTTILSKLGGTSDTARLEMRRAKINTIWESVTKEVFQEAAHFILAHTNAVYIMSGEKGSLVKRFDRPASANQTTTTGKVLVVYSDDSMVRSELDNRQELIKMKFHIAGEKIELVKIIPSVNNMKQRHPFAAKQNTPTTNEITVPKPILPKETCDVLAQKVENPTVRDSITRAMTAFTKN
jgi:hypothetical protein